MITTTIVSDGNKNASVLVRGFVTTDITDPMVVLDLDKLKDSPKNIRVDGLWWMLEEKLGIRLWWSPGQILLPLESRNAFRPDNPLVGPANGWSRKILMTTHDAKSATTPVKYFVFSMDLEKS